MEKETKKYYSKCKQRKHSHPVIHAFAIPKLEWINSKIIINNKKVLEVGGGNGYFSAQLMKICNLSVVDISKHQIRKNPAKNKTIGSAYKLPFNDNSFDVVFCSNLLHHLDDPLKALTEMKRVSKDMIIISEPNRNNPVLFLGSLIFKHERNAIKYSKRFLRKNIEKVNLSIKYHTYIGGLVMPNATPAFMLPFVRPKSKNHLSFFQIFICKKK